MPCKNCGSHAINPRQGGRGEDRLDLCDVCYWRERFVGLQEAVRWERECERVDQWANRYRVWPAVEETGENYNRARAAVDALVGEG